MKIDLRKLVAYVTNGVKSSVLVEAMARQQLLLAQFLPYRLSIAMQAVSEGLALRYSQEFGISIPEWRIIATLGENSEMTARDIAVHARMNKTMVSRAAADLVRRRIVTRRTSREDRREAFLRLTRQGEDIYAAIVPLALDYERGLTAGMSGAEVAMLRRLLDQLLGQADKAAEKLASEKSAAADTAAAE
ncbi:MarR family winged helix-turn-helix transcriptional regulator [Roseiarcaceae bacterium H3SJ34-1]|uniref:MarR family winged helix-turn-helix transcriptional regulator n=1 Tax=Terripilifer ovatus TaxID=3032367 RepID=UPI003AB96A79|nr:MarR family winged helix-turn-helix transcriptional regulator [Roseiarcaceae bacterium H3SJ34-1]